MTANSITIEKINTKPEYDPYVNIAGHRCLQRAMA